MSDPQGCLACNHDEVAVFLRGNGLDPARLEQCPPTRHAWSDVMHPCSECGATFILRPAAAAERDALIRARLAKVPEMTPEQQARQRESWARGNAEIDGYEPSGGRTSCWACNGTGCTSCCDPAEFATNDD